MLNQFHVLCLQSPVCINSSVDIECTITQNAAIGHDLSVLNYSWYQNGTVLDSSNTNISSTDQKVFTTRLSITSLMFTDGGEYTCEANVIETEQVMNSTIIDIESIDLGNLEA